MTWRLPAPVTALLGLGLGLCLGLGCGSDDNRICPEGPLFTVSPVDPDSIQNVDPLGNLNPPGHVFPSDHGGIYVTGGGPVGIYAPGDLTIVKFRAVLHVNEGLTDFALYFEYCDRIYGYLGHVASLDADTFGDLADYSEWTFDGEYSTGGETYRNWIKTTTFDVAAGTRLGTTRNTDFGIIDRTGDPVVAASPSRWGEGDYRYAHHFLDYYEDGPARAELEALVNRPDFAGDTHPYGAGLQDVPGTAHGCWFLPGASFPPEDEHLALVQSHIHAPQEAFSVGTSVATLASGVWLFDPQDDGVLNRPFADVTPDGTTYGYTIASPDRTVFIAMPDAATLWIQAIDGTHTDPAAWVFTDDKTVFVR